MRCTRIYSTVVVVVLVIVAPAALAQQQQPNPDFVSALNSIEAGEYAQARTALQRVVKAEPDNEAAWYYLGVAEYMTENLEEAVQAFQEALKLAPKRVGIRLYIGRIYEAQGALQEAIGVYEQEVFRAKGPQKAEVLVALGRVYSETGSLNEARQVLREAVEIEANYVEALYHLGRSEMQLEEYADAIETFKKAKKSLEEWNDFQVRLQRLSVEEQRRLKQTEETMVQQYARVEHFAKQLGLWPALNKARGDAYLAAGQWAAARNAYRAALDRKQLGNPSDSDAYARVAGAFLADAKEMFEVKGMLFSCIAVLKQAEKSIDEALEYDAQYASAHEIRGEVYAFQAATYVSDPEREIVSHTYEEAIEEFAKALEVAPQYQRAMLHLGRAHLARAARLPAGQAEAAQALQQARTVIDEALALSPGDAELYAELARVELAEEKWPAALETARHALTIDADNVTALNTAGLACYYQNRLGEAAEYFTDAIGAAPEQGQAYTNLGNTFLQMQSWYRARREYRKALDRIPTAVTANTAYQRSYILYLIGLTYHQTRMYDQEIEALNNALALDPAYALAYRQLSRAYLAKEEYRASRRALEIALQQTPTEEEKAQVHAQIGQVYEAEDDTHSAIAAYSLALKLNPENLIAADAIRRLTQ